MGMTALNVNQEITCEHQNIALRSIRSRRLAPAEVWRIIRERYNEGKEFPVSPLSLLSVCGPSRPRMVDQAEEGECTLCKEEKQEKKDAEEKV